MAYECENCNRVFKHPQAVYSVEENGITKIISSQSDRFSAMEFLHTEHSWYSCPYCGSEKIIDLSD